MESLETLWAMQPEAFSAFMHCAAHENVRRHHSFPDSEPEDTPLYELAEGGVAVIPVEGVILRRGRFSNEVGLRAISGALDAALAAPEVRAILLSIHSPGGQARGVKEVADAIFAARRQKPCAAWVDGLCASAAYWLASATGAIYAGPSAEVGSIGVILRHMDKSGWNKEMGLAFTYVTAGAFKAVGNPDAALSERDLVVLQARVNAIYDMFCGDVAQHMKLAPENRELWADGRDFLASEAETLGLVTAVVASRAEAINHLMKEIHMDKAELAKSHPELLADIQREAADAALAGQAQQTEKKADEAVSAAVDRTLMLMATVCGQEAADKVAALVRAGVTPEQLAAAAQALNMGAQGASGVQADAPAAPTAPDAGKKPGAAMLEAIKAATPGAVNATGSGRDDVAATIMRIGKM